MTAKTHNGRPIKGIECKHAVHVELVEERSDIHFVKEVIHYEDGTFEPNTRIIKNFKRPYYITKLANRNHQQKKEFESRDKVDIGWSTQTQLVHNVSMALHHRPPARRASIRDLSESPYLYGTDMLSSTYLKYTYKKKFGDLITPYNVAVLDTETDVVEGFEDIIMVTLSFKSRIFTAIIKRYFRGMADVDRRLKEAFHKYLSGVEMIRDKKKGPEIVDIIKERMLNWEFVIVDNEFEAVKAAIQKAHEWQPDLVAFWNMNFDMTKMIDACQKVGYPLEKLFSDPSVPKPYQYFRYKQGPDKRITESGVVKTIEPSENWHIVYTPASFYFVDAMCVYRRLRIADGKEPSYALDAVLNKNLGARKLKFAATDHLSGIRWHREMQANYKFEYVIYNLFDCISVELLDERTKDLQFAFASQCGSSDFSLFPSQPKRLCDNISFFIEENENLVWGTTGPNMYTDFDEMTPSNSGWIITLPSNLVADNGLQCIEEYPNMRTNIRTHFGDLDVSASYPNNGAVFNISKSTTMKELCQIRDVPDELRRAQGLNLSGGRTNAVEFSTRLLGLPMLPDLLEEFNAEMM